MHATVEQDINRKVCPVEVQQDVESSIHLSRKSENVKPQDCFSSEQDVDEMQQKYSPERPCWLAVRRKTADGGRCETRGSVRIRFFLSRQDL
jgi:hypothetical protein